MFRLYYARFLPGTGNKLSLKNQNQYCRTAPTFQGSVCQSFSEFGQRLLPKLKNSLILKKNPIFSLEFYFFRRELVVPGAVAGNHCSRVSYIKYFLQLFIYTVGARIPNAFGIPMVHSRWVQAPTIRILNHGQPGSFYIKTNIFIFI